MTTRTRLSALRDTRGFRARSQRKVVEALAGDGAGNVLIAARPDWIWVRLWGDADCVHRAHLSANISVREDDPLLLEEVKRTGLGEYRVLGYSLSQEYDYEYSDTQQMGRIGAHHEQHERYDGNTGGEDPVNVYPRMFVPLRARSQAVPNMTLRIDPGYNPLTGNYMAASNSPTFVAPVFALPTRLDLLYLGADDAYHIVQGTPVAWGATPVEPELPGVGVSIAVVTVNVSTTALTEANIYRDARIVVAARTPLISDVVCSGGDVVTSAGEVVWSI